MKKHVVMPSILVALLVGLALVPLRIGAATPGILSYQGRVLVTSVPFTGTGQFKFALVNSTGSTTFWSNDGTSSAGSEPSASVSLTVANGLYAVLLGDSSISGMTQAIPATAFDNADVRLRIWFNDGTNGSKRLEPDQRIAPVGYAQVAKGVDDGSISTAKIADGSVTNVKINDVAAIKITGTVSTAQIAGGAVTPAKISGFPKCKVYAVATQQISSATSTAIAFDEESFDTNSMHDKSVNNSRITIPESGTYLITGTLQFAVQATGDRGLVFKVNGQGLPEIAAVNARAAAGIQSALTTSVVLQLNATDYVEMYGFQNSGAPINTFPYNTEAIIFSVIKLP